MPRFLEYALFFVVVVVLQVFLFDNLNLNVYIYPMIYIAFIILLPMNLPSIVVLLLGLVTGVTMDFFSGASGLHTIATLATAFARPLPLLLFLGKEEVKEGGVPLPVKIGTGQFFRYSSVLVVFHCLVFFGFETLTFKYFYLTLLRIILSSALTILLVYFSHMLLIGSNKSSKHSKV